MAKWLLGSTIPEGGDQTEPGGETGFEKTQQKPHYHESREVGGCRMAGEDDCPDHAAGVSQYNQLEMEWDAYKVDARNFPRGNLTSSRDAGYEKDRYPK